jgi:hypothetical protein
MSVSRIGRAISDRQTERERSSSFMSGRAVELALSRRAEAAAADAQAARILAVCKAMPLSDPRCERMRQQAITA